jgi:hypothetical protein
MAKLVFLQDSVWDGTVSRGGQNMFVLQWMRGLERLGHEVIFIDLIQSNFSDGREAMLRAFDQVISKWWHPQQTALLVMPTMEALYGVDIGQLSRFAESAAGLVTVSDPFRREPPDFIRNVRPRIFSSPIRLIRTSGQQRQTRQTSSASMIFTLPSAATSVHRVALSPHTAFTGGRCGTRSFWNGGSQRR